MFFLKDQNVYEPFWGQSYIFDRKNVYKEYQRMEAGDILLIWGETGSGKTEVYMRVAEEELLKNKSCLIMAPEIGLVPQLVDRFSKNGLRAI